MVQILDMEDFGTLSFGDGDSLETQFRRIRAKLSESLLLEPLLSQVRIETIEENIPVTDIFSLGVRRSIDDSSIHLTISEHYESFLPFILLREAYYCFVPPHLLSQKRIKIFVNQFVEIALSSHPASDTWRGQVRKHTVDNDYWERYERLEKFFKSYPNTTEGPIGFFFRYIRQNLSVLERKEILYDDLFRAFISSHAHTIYSDEIVETIRVFTKLFYKLQVYTSLSEYAQNLAELKEQGEISTDLSPWKFKKHMRWLKRSSYIAPNYYIFAKRLGINPNLIFIRFHPYYSSQKNLTNLLLRHFPFLTYVRTEYDGFALSMVGYMYLPHKYQRDLLNTLKFLKRRGIALDVHCFDLKKMHNNLNLNYYREFHDPSLLVNRRHKEYEKQFELEFFIELHKDKREQNNFYSPSPLEFLLLDRIRYYSHTGFGFEQPQEALTQLKSDFLNELLRKVTHVNQLREKLSQLRQHKDIQSKVLSLLEKFAPKGIFYVREFLTSIAKTDSFLREFTETHHITNMNQFQKEINRMGINIFSETLDDRNLRLYITTNFLPVYFNDRKIYLKEMETHTVFSEIIDLFLALKLYNIHQIRKVIKSEGLVSTIFSKKRDKLKALHEEVRVDKITLENIQRTVQGFLNTTPPLIKPCLLTSILTTPFAKYNLFIVLKDSRGMRKKIEEMKSIFPRFIIEDCRDLLAGENVCILDLYLPNLPIKQKNRLIFSLRALFGDDMLSLLRLSTHGIINAISLKEFYDFETSSYFYTSDLFSQFTRYVSSISKGTAGMTRPFVHDEKHLSMMENHLQTHPNDLDSLAKEFHRQSSHRSLDFNPTNINELVQIHRSLIPTLTDLQKFKELQTRYAFTTYVDAVRFIPHFGQFGFSHYFVWTKLKNLSEVNLKSFLTNSFLNVKTSTKLGRGYNSLLISYLFPLRTPNTSYLNWLLHTKRLFLEYFMLTPTCVHQIFQFSKNLTKQGWDLSADKFLTFAKSRIMNPGITPDTSVVSNYSLDDIGETIYGPNSEELTALSTIFSYAPEDVKPYLSQHPHSKADSFRYLLNKDLLFPYIELKNVNFKEVLYIILPEMDSETQSTLLQIFTFFNYCFVYEVEGKYFLEGMNEVARSRNGLVIELYLPDCELHEFFSGFYEIFTLLGISRYAVSHDLVDGKNLLEKAFGDSSFLETYSPLYNLVWNEFDNKWTNIQLVTEKFEFVPISFSNSTITQKK